MRLIVIRILISWMIGFGFSSVAIADSEANVGFFIPKFGDYQSDAVEAKKAGKVGMLLFFEWDECPYCQKMRKTVLTKTRVQQTFNRYFSPIAVDIVGGVEVTFFDGKIMSEKAIAKHYNIRATPTLMLVDFSGKELYRLVGPIYHEEDMLAFSDYLSRQDYSKGKAFWPKNKN